MQQRRIFHSVRLLLLGLALLLAASHAAHAQNLNAIGSKLIPEQKASENDPEKLRRSLDVVIQALEDKDQRRALVSQLKAMREGAQDEQEAGSGKAARRGLLGALADSFNQLGEQAKTGQTPLDFWIAHSRHALAQMRTLFTNPSQTELRHNLLQIVAGLAVWLVALLALARGARLLFARRGWPLMMPPEPRAWQLLAHFLRRTLPVLLTFLGLLFTMSSLDTTTAARAVVLVAAYATLCARTLTSVVDIMISLFTSGHRRTAVAILHRKAPKPLFAIGLLVALSDAISNDRLTALLGLTLSDWLSETTSLVAALISGFLVLRVRRPVQHLIRNRPYSQRRTPSATSDLGGLVANLWHIPALLAIGASMVAIVLTGGSTEIAFAKAIVSAVLLVLALLVAGLLRRQRERRTRPAHKNRYIQRFARLGYTLKHCAIWVVFAELSAQIWGMSLVGIGRPNAVNEQIAQALFAIALTALLSSLLWIVADTALERALGGGRRGQRKVTARTQTVVPMLRNTVFFAILLIAGIAALANLGVNVTPLLAGAGIIGLAVGFGAQNLVQDLITGIFILVEDSVAVGDFIQINNHMGTVEGLNLRTVRLRDLDGILHFITFSHISSIHNMSRQFGIALLKIRVPHDLPIDEAVSLMRETAAELRKGWRMGRLIRSPLEMQGIHAFEEGCPILRMRMRTAPEYQWDVGRAFNLKLKQIMEQRYVNLAAPRLSVSMDGSAGDYQSEASGELRGDADAETAQPTPP
jgi:small-conductance mechanosensitive channel